MAAAHWLARHIRVSLLLPFINNALPCPVLLVVMFRPGHCLAVEWVMVVPADLSGRLCLGHNTTPRMRHIL